MEWLTYLRMVTCRVGGNPFCFHDSPSETCIVLELLFAQEGKISYFSTIKIKLNKVNSIKLKIKQNKIITGN